MKLPSHIPLYGNSAFRGKCPKEAVEQASAINRIRQLYPDTFGALVFHPRNEQQLTGGQHSAMIRHKAEGLTAGVPDLIVPGAPSCVIEIKRCDHTLSKISDEQIDYLTKAQEMGAFVAIALGAVAAIEAFDVWRLRYYPD
jgi:hypothetical protein